MKKIVLALALVAAYAAGAAAQDGVRPCKPPRQAWHGDASAASPDPQKATGVPASPEQDRQTADAAVCETAPPATR